MTRIRLQNAALEAEIDAQGAKVVRLIFRSHQSPVLHENPAGAMFPMLPLANRVAGNRFLLR
ncbi:MAG: aldose 1-epimerase, partial [Hafnia sp.]